LPLDCRQADQPALLVYDQVLAAAEFHALDTALHESL
jgi:hypothetical protein